jgi:hypothetical protein
MEKTLEDFEAYLSRITNGASRRAVADAAGIEPSTLTRQLQRGRVPVETTVAICRAFHADLLEAFVEAGYITSLEATGLTGRGALDAATDLQLAEEILRRVQAASSTDLETPLDDEHPAVQNVLGAPRDGQNVVNGRFGGAGSRRYALDAAALERKSSHFDEAAASEELP